MPSYILERWQDMDVDEANKVVVGPSTIDVVYGALAQFNHEKLVLSVVVLLFMWAHALVTCFSKNLYSQVTN